MLIQWFVAYYQRVVQTIQDHEHEVPYNDLLASLYLLCKSAFFPDPLRWCGSCGAYLKSHFDVYTRCHECAEPICRGCTEVYQRDYCKKHHPRSYQAERIQCAYHKKCMTYSSHGYHRYALPCNTTVWLCRNHLEYGIPHRCYLCSWSADRRKEEVYRSTSLCGDVMRVVNGYDDEGVIETSPVVVELSRLRVGYGPLYCLKERRVIYTK